MAATRTRLGDADRANLEDVVRRAEQLCRFEFSVFVGHAEGDPRSYAQQLHAALVAPARSILIMVDPQARAVEVVTGTEVRRNLPDQQVELGVAAMRDRFAAGELLDGLRRGVQHLAEHARSR